MLVRIFPFSFIDSNGLPLDGGMIHCYEAGTTTRSDTYRDSEGSLNGNPIVLDSRGCAKIWIDDGKKYDFVIEDKYGNYVDSEEDYEASSADSAKSEDLDRHVKSMDNPHEVTAEQVGAYTKEETDSKVDSLDEKIDDVESRIPSVNVTSQDNSIKVRTYGTGNNKTFDISSRVPEFEYAFLEGESLSDLKVTKGNMRVSDGIVVAKKCLYHVIVSASVKVGSLSDDVGFFFLKVDGERFGGAVVKVDCTDPDNQHFMLSMDYVTNDTGLMVLAIDEDSLPEGFKASFLFHVQIHRVCSDTGETVTLDKFNELFYGDGLETSSLKDLQVPGNHRMIVAVRNGASPELVPTTDFQPADIVVTESEYEQMEQEGLVDPEKRYVIVED